MSKYINVRKHANKDYALHCYNKKAFYDRAWDEETIHSRGHVYDAEGNVLSYPFPKFFNIDENELVKREDVVDYIFEHQEDIEVLHKYNGHLCILFHDGDEWINTTKGSFEHDFVELDRIVLEDSGFTEEALKDIPVHWTMCFEIVADYDPHLLTETHKKENGTAKDFAVLLGVNDTRTEHSVSPDEWVDIVTEANVRVIFAHAFLVSFETKQDVSDRLDQWKQEEEVEGFIIHDTVTDWRVKVKTDWFIYNRYVFQFNSDKTRNVFRKWFDSEKAFEKIPEELHERYHDIIDDYYQFHLALEGEMMATFSAMWDLGVRMNSEYREFVRTNVNLTDEEKDVMIAFLTNKGFKGKGFDLFCNKYEKFSLV